MKRHIPLVAILSVACTPAGREPGGSGGNPGGTDGSGGSAGVGPGGAGGGYDSGSAGSGGLDAGSGRDGAGGAGGIGGSGGTGGSGAGGSPPQADAGRPDNGCVENFDLQRGPPPNVVIVLDKSGSMNAARGAETLWTQSTRALKSVVTATQAEVRWGISFFPSDVDCAVPTVEVPVKISNYPAIETAIAGKQPSGNTPTRKAVEEATRYLDALADPAAKYIMLATDGAPNCGMQMCPDGYTLMGMNCCKGGGVFGGMSCMGTPGDSPPDEVGAEAAVTTAATKGYHTFVVGLGVEPSFEATLDRLAVAGKEPRTGAVEKYYRADDEPGLVTAMKAIASTIISCEVPLSRAPAEPDRVRITLGASFVPRDPMRKDGWDFGPSMMSVIFYGSYCEMLQSGASKDVAAYFGCGTV